MTSMTISLGAMRLSVRIGCDSRRTPPLSALPETLDAVDLPRRLKTLIGVERPVRLRLVS